MKRYIKLVAISALLLVFSVANTVFAEAGMGMGGDCGEVDGDCFTQAYIGVTGGSSSWSLADGTAITVNEDSPVFGGVVLGYRMNKFFALELVGNYFGEPDYVDINPIEVRVCNTGLGLNFYLPLGRVIDDVDYDFISVFAKGGMHYWDFESTDAIAPVNDSTDDGADLYYGFGVNFDVKRHIAIRAEHSVYDLEIGGVSKDISTNALTLILKF